MGLIIEYKLLFNLINHKTTNLLHLTIVLTFTILSNTLSAQVNNGLEKTNESILPSEAILESLTFDSLYNLSNKLRINNQYDVAKSLANRALELSEKGKNRIEISRAYYLLSLIEMSASRNKTADSILAVAFKQAPISIQQKLLIKRASVNYRLGDLKAMTEYLDLAQNYEKASDPNQELEYLNLRLLLNYDLNNIKQALDFGNRAKKLAEKHENNYYICIINSNLGLLYNELKLYSEAFNLSLASYNSAVASSNDWNQIFALIALARIQLNTENYLEAKKYCFEAIKVKKRANLSPAFGHVYSYLGQAYEAIVQLDSAHFYYQKAILISQNQNEPDIYPHVRLSNLYFKKGDLKAARKHAELAIKPNVSNDVKQERNEILGKIALAENKPKEALAYFEESIKLLKDSKKDSLQRVLISQLLKTEIEQEKKVETLEMNKILVEQRQRLIFSSIVCLLLLGLVSGLFWGRRQNKLKQSLLAKDLKNQKLITAQSQQLNNMIKSKNDELQKVSQLKEKLFTNIAHELRTPLSLVLNPLKDLEELNEKTNKKIQRAIVSGENLNAMIGQILELSKINLGKSVIKLNEFGIKNLLDYIFYKFEALATYKEIDFKVSHSTNNTRLVTDAKKIETVISNLISNALKYTPTYGKIRLEVIQLSDNLQFIVQDTGMGMPEETLAKIFSEYYQIGQDKVIPEGGIGIGLAICKEYVKLLGGQIEVTSEVSKGSSFKFVIPRKFSATSDRTVTKFEFPLPKLERSISKKTISPIQNSKGLAPTILIVEDNLEMCKYLQEILEQEYHLTFAYNGDAALKKISKEKPQLVITDLMMPVMDGITLINKLRSQKDLKELPILVLSARDSVLDELKVFRLGVDDFLSKPFDELELKTHIYNLLEYSDFLKERELYQEDSKIKTTIDNHGINEQDNKFLNYLENHIDTLSKDFDLDVELLAKKLYMSKANLTRKMKKLTGLTPKRYINEIRMLNARRLILENGLLTVKRISIEVGFKDEKLFARNFKARFGKYPSDFIRRMAGNRNKTNSNDFLL